MAKRIKIINSPKGFDLIDIAGTQFLDDKVIKFIYRKRSKLGKLLKIKKIKKINKPKGFRVGSVNNHTPSLNKVKITFLSIN